VLNPINPPNSLDMAAITAGWLLVYYIAGGIGSAIGGGIWTNLVPGKLEAYFTNTTLAQSAYANPTGFIKIYLPGTPERMAIARAHDETQRILVIVGMSVSILALLVACLIPNVRLPDTQSMEEDGGEDGSLVAGRVGATKAPIVTVQ